MPPAFLMALAILGAPGVSSPSSLEGPWRAALDVAGGPLRFSVTLEQAGNAWRGQLCNGRVCLPFSGVAVQGDSVRFELADYAAHIDAAVRGDSLVGRYQNVGNRGPRTISFRAARGTWPVGAAPSWLAGTWEAWVHGAMNSTPRMLEFRQGARGLEGTIISNSGDYGHFWGRAEQDSFSLSHFDGSYVYMLTGRLAGDTLRGLFHAGLRTQTPFTAVRGPGTGHLKAPTEITSADTSAPFQFSFPDVDGRIVTNRDPRFRGKVLLVDVFGTWCPTCHDAAPVLTSLYRDYHARGLEIVGLAFEVTGDTAVDGRLVRRYRDKFGIEFPLLLAGINDVEAAAATLPQLQGFTSFPTTIFLDRRGTVRRIHAGFYGPAMGAQHERLIQEFRREVERLLVEQ